MSSRQIEHLVKMANQIAVNLGAGRDPDEAARLTDEHLQKFWTRDMRAQLKQHAQQHPTALSDTVHRALAADNDGGS